MVENAGNHCKIRLKSLPTLSDSDPRLQLNPFFIGGFIGVRVRTFNEIFNGFLLPLTIRHEHGTHAACPDAGETQASYLYKK